MKKTLLLFMSVGILISCNRNDESVIHGEQNYLIFGHFYGECFGETCVETFKLTDNNLYEDTVDDYSGQNLDFTQLSNEKFELVNDLASFFPSELLNESEVVLGCPDCADGGGLYIIFANNGTVQSWRIDQMQNNVPSYLHDFMDSVNEKIGLINN